MATINDSVTARFVECHNEIISSGKVRSSRQFAISLDYLPQSLSEILKGRRKVTVELLRKSIEVYEISANYLFVGTGSAFKNSEKENSKNDVLVVVADSNNCERIVHVPYPAHAGYGGQLANPEFIRDLPTFTLPDPYFQSGTFRSFDVSGDSMEPTLYEGERVVCSFTEKDSWRHSLKNNHVYIIITCDDIVVKRVENRIYSDGMLILHSDNDYYPPRSLPINEVLEIWTITLKISPFMASPKNIRNALHSEIDDLRDTMDSQTKRITGLNQTIEKLLRQNRSR